jgi:hypothetical protein
MKVKIILLASTLLTFAVGLSLPCENEAEVSFEYTLNPDHLDGAFTGGFGEQTCHSCHFDYDLNREGGSLLIQGLEDSYQPGNEYEITVTVESEHLENGGFQLTSRF